MDENKIFILDERDKTSIEAKITEVSDVVKDKAASDLSNVTEDALTNLGAAKEKHNHDMSDFNDVVSVDKGGTGANSSEGARTNLGVYSIDSVNTLLLGKADSVHPHALATSSASGMMSSEDKAKLDMFPTKIIIHQGSSSLPVAEKGAILIAYDA